MTGFPTDPWYPMQLQQGPFEDLQAAIDTLREKILHDARELQQKECWAKIVKECVEPLKLAAMKCLPFLQQSGFPGVYITKFSGWKKFAKDVGKEEMRQFFGMSQKPFFQRVLDPDDPNDRAAIEEHNSKKDKEMILKPMFFQRLKNSWAIFQEEGPQWLVEGCDPNIENLVMAILWLYSPMKLQKDCLVTLRPACLFRVLDPLWRHEDKGYVFNCWERPDSFFQPLYPAELMPDKNRLTEWQMAAVEHRAEEYENLADHESPVQGTKSASTPAVSRWLTFAIRGTTHERKRFRVSCWPELQAHEWDDIERMLKLGKYKDLDKIAVYQMGAVPRQNQDAAKLDADTLRAFMCEEQRESEVTGKPLPGIVVVNLTQMTMTAQLRIPELQKTENVRRESIRDLRRRLGIGKPRLLLFQRKDREILLEDDVQLETLVDDELKLADTGNILSRDKIKIEMKYLKGFDHPYIMRILEEDLVGHTVVSPLPHWRSSAAALRGPTHRAAAARAAVIDVAAALRHLHQNGWGHMDVQPCNLQITGQVKKDTPDSVDLKLCLVDAGSAGLFGSELRNWSSRYALPQVRSGDMKTMRRALDWFALGMTVKDLAEGLWPQIMVEEKTPLTLVEASQKTEPHEVASAASAASTSTFSLVAFPEGSAERLGEADNILVSDAELKLQPGLQLDNYDTGMDKQEINDDGDVTARRDRVLKKVSENGRILESLPSTFKSMEDVVMAAVQQNGWALQFADAKYRGNRGIVEAAVRQEGQALEFASPQLQNDRNVVLEAVKNSSWALEFASESWRNDRDLVASAVRFNPWALELASQELRQSYVLTWSDPPGKDGVDSQVTLIWAALKL